MSYEFDGSTQYLENGSSTPITAAPLTVALWFKSDSISAAQSLINIKDASVTAQYFSLTALGPGGGDPISWNTRSGATNLFVNSTTGYSADTWHHACGISASATDHRAFLDGGGKATDATSVAPSGIDMISVGRRGGAGSGAETDGSISHPCIWDVALTDEEVAALAAGAHPLSIRPESIVFYMPPDNYNDIIGGISLTATGTPTTDDEPPVASPALNVVIPGVAAGGDTTISGNLESISLTTMGATIQADVDSNITGALESIDLTTFAATIQADTDIAGALESIDLTTFAATIQADTDLAGALESIELSTFAATISAGTDIAGALESIDLTTNQGTISTGNVVSGALESIDLTTFAATVQADVDTSIAGALEAIELSTSQGTVQGDVDTSIAGALESIDLTTFASAITLDVALAGALESIELSTFAGDISGASTVSGALESIDLTTFAAAVRLITPRVRNVPRTRTVSMKALVNHVDGNTNQREATYVFSNGRSFKERT